MILVERFAPGTAPAHHRRGQDRHLMTMVPRRHPEEALPVSARERAIPFAPMAEMQIAVGPDTSHVQLNAGSRASKSEHRAAVTRLARSRRPRRAAKSP